MPGHEFMKKLGRTKLRPGGIGTQWLFDTVDWNPNMDILEVVHVIRETIL